MTDYKLINQTLSHYFDSISEIELLKAGNDNENYSFFGDSKKYVLRIYNEVLTDKRSEESIEEELDFIDFFSNHGVDTPGVIKDKENKKITKLEERFCAVFEFCEGGFVYGRLQATHFEQVGELMSKMHLLTEQNNLHTKKKWKNQDKWEYLFDLEEIKSLKGEEESIVRDLKASVNMFKAQTSYFTHNDYHFANILFERDTLSALLDFDGFNEAYFCDDIGRFLAADLAYSPVLDYDLSQEFVDSYFKGYTKNRQLTEEDHTLIKRYIDLNYLLQLRRLQKENPEKISEFRDQINRLRKYIAKY